MTLLFVSKCKTNDKLTQLIMIVGGDQTKQQQMNANLIVSDTIWKTGHQIASQSVLASKKVQALKTQLVSCSGSSPFCFDAHAAPAPTTDAE
jgi:hypothetical protein